MTTGTTRATARYAPYLPALARSWPAGSPYRQLDATLVSVDLSGFTALSERLAQKGKAGAEELILVVSGCFEGLIGIASRHDGDVLKFRGDALLLLFGFVGYRMGPGLGYYGGGGLSLILTIVLILLLLKVI